MPTAETTTTTTPAPAALEQAGIAVAPEPTPLAAAPEPTRLAVAAGPTPPAATPELTAPGAAACYRPGLVQAGRDVDRVLLRRRLEDTFLSLVGGNPKASGER